MAHGGVDDVVHHTQVVHSVNSGATVIRLVHRVSNDVGLVDSSDHVEMHRVSSKLEGLTDIGKFDIGNSTDGT